jgi:hypothetical protein
VDGFEFSHWVCSTEMAGIAAGGALSAQRKASTSVSLLLWVVLPHIGSPGTEADDNEGEHCRKANKHSAHQWSSPEFSSGTGHITDLYKQGC